MRSDLWAYVSRKRAAIVFGWVFFLILVGSPRMLRAHMGHTCGEPNEIELAAAYAGLVVGANAPTLC